MVNDATLITLPYNNESEVITMQEKSIYDKYDELESSYGRKYALSVLAIEYSIPVCILEQVIPE